MFIVGGVASRAEGFTQFSDLWIPLVFHTICMVTGMLCYTASSDGRVPAEASRKPVSSGS